MAAISKSFGFGGDGLEPHGSAGRVTLAQVLRDIADDLDALQGATGAAIASPDSQFTTIASADASDLASAQTLVNEIKATLNADMPTVIDLLNEIKTNLAAVSSGVTLLTTKA